MSTQSPRNGGRAVLQSSSEGEATLDDGAEIAQLRLVQSEAHRWRGELVEAEACARDAIEGLLAARPGWYRALGTLIIASGQTIHGMGQINAALTNNSTIVADLANEPACLHAVQAAVARFGRVDAVINNAGIGVSSLRPDAEVCLPAIEELTAEIWNNFFNINVRAPMLVTRAAVPEMKRRGWGRIINNTTSFRTMLRVLPYGATKAALESMSAVWAKELDGSGITVNVLIPGGPTDTPFIADGSGWPRDRMLRPRFGSCPMHPVQ